MGCTCGRSPTGKCVGWHNLSEEDYQSKKIAWEIKQKSIIDMAADRGPFIDQSQSMNLHIPNCSLGKLSALHFHAWNRGLKTGMYYLRTKAAMTALKKPVADPPQACSRILKQNCEACQG